MVELFSEALRRVVSDIVDARLAERGAATPASQGRSPDDLIGHREIYADYGYSPSSVRVWVKSGWLERDGGVRSARYKRASVEAVIHDRGRKCATRTSKRSVDDRADAILRR